MTKGECVAEAIKDKIIKDGYREGDKLPSEAELCGIFNVSRTSVRRAIHTLAAEGVINTYHGKGSFVSGGYPAGMNANKAFSNTKIGRIDMFEFRRIFEAENAALAASRADEEIINMLQETVKGMETAETPEAAAEMDMKFHYLIAKSTQNAIMMGIYDMLGDAYRKMFSENVALRRNEGYKEHIKILSAIESRNPEQARQYMAEHLNKSMMQNTVSLYMQTENDN